MNLFNRRNFLKSLSVVPLSVATVSGRRTFFRSKLRHAHVGTPSYSVSPGPTNFIANVDITGVNGASLTGAGFEVVPAAGATSTPISAMYAKTQLLSKGYLSAATDNATLTLPVFGLYASAANTVNQVIITLNYGGVVTTKTVQITTTPWSDAYLSTPTITQARASSVPLAYSYFVMKTFNEGFTPAVIDVDGQVRWVGTIGGSASQASTYFQGAMYVALGTSLWRNDLDGTYTRVADYGSFQVDAATGTVNYIQHHNIDFGKKGLLLEVNTNLYTESTILEVDTSGNVLATFSLSSIISAAMTAGGDDPSQFVPGPGNGSDWFHNNAAAYWPEQDALIVSSRENFVIAIGYESKKILWILGDVQKQWYQFPSLRAFALTPTPGTVTPIGQHALSVVNNQLLLFDDGYQSFNHGPSGNSRGFSVPRKYAIDPVAMTASDVWSFYSSPPIWSDICSSVYQVGETYLVDYAAQGGGPILMGLGPNNQVAFQYLYGGGFTTGWNAYPIDLNNTAI